MKGARFSSVLLPALKRGVYAVWSAPEYDTCPSRGGTSDFLNAETQRAQRGRSRFVWAGRCSRPHRGRSGGSGSAKMSAPSAGRAIQSPVESTETPPRLFLCDLCVSAPLRLNPTRPDAPPISAPPAGLCSSVLPPLPRNSCEIVTPRAFHLAHLWNMAYVFPGCGRAKGLARLYFPQPATDFP